jgi:hypothetical protein
MTIDRTQAAEALTDIDAITRRVRQSRFYRFSSQLMVLWGALTAVGYGVTFLSPASATPAWIGVYIVGIAASVAIGGIERVRSEVRAFDYRLLAAYLLFIGFGLLWTVGLVQLSPRLLCAFWPTYFALAYAIAGLWFGFAFVAIGLGIAALTIVGYFYSGAWFDLWMAFVNGGGLALGGLWMRRN